MTKHFHGGEAFGGVKPLVKEVQAATVVHLPEILLTWIVRRCVGRGDEKPRNPRTW
jgi:hypothetical protein